MANTTYTPRFTAISEGKDMVRLYAVINYTYYINGVKSKFSAYNFKKIRIPQFSETRFGSFVGLFSCFYVYKQ